MKKLQNKGFTLVELLVVLVVLVVLSIFMTKKYKHDSLVSYYQTQVERLNETGNLIQNAVFEMDGVPDSLEDMIENGYDYSCQTTSGVNKDYCTNINKTLWGEKITLISENDDKIHSILVPMTKLSERERNLFIGMASKEIPHATVDGVNLKISYSLLSTKVWTVNTGGGGGSVDSDLYIPSDGSKPLTDNWFIGDDKKIVDVKDISLSMGEGKDQLSVSSGLIRDTGTVLSGESVPKPICTTPNTKEHIVTWFNGVTPNDLSKDAFTSISSIYARPIDNGDSWVLWTSFTALSLENNKYEVFNDYSLRSDPSAKKAGVLMGYLTTCRSTKNI